MLLKKVQTAFGYGYYVYFDFDFQVVSPFNYCVLYFIVNIGTFEYFLIINLCCSQTTLCVFPFTYCELNHILSLFSFYSMFEYDTFYYHF